jgi:hypothetical protein
MSILEADLALGGHRQEALLGSGVEKAKRCCGFRPMVSEAGGG